MEIITAKQSISSPLRIGDEYVIRWSDSDRVIIINESIIRLSGTEYTLFKLFLDRLMRQQTFPMVIPLETLLSCVDLMNPEHVEEGVHKVPDSMVKKLSRLRRRISAYFLIQTVMAGGKVSGYQMALANNPFIEDEQNNSYV